MRILQALGWYYPENLGGTETYVAALSKKLVEAGHEVFIAAPLAGLPAPRSYDHDGLNVFRYPIPERPTRAEAQGRFPARGSEDFTGWLRQIQPDVSHFHSIVTGLGLHEMRAVQRDGSRIVFTSHASSLGYICQRGTLMRLGRFPCDGLTEIVKCSSCALEHRGMPLPIARLIAHEPLVTSRLAGAIDLRFGTALGMPDLIHRNKLAQRELLSVVDRFVVLTRAAERIMKLNGAPDEKLVVNELGISEYPGRHERAKALETASRPVKFGYLGRFDVVKGVIELAHALKSLPSKMDFTFEFRGPVSTASETAVLNRVRRLLSGDQRVSFAPAVPPYDVQRVLAAYDVLVCPSVCAEGGPTVAIEAHAAGTPVIGTQIGGLPELITDEINGAVVPPGDVAALAALLARVIMAPHETIDRWRLKLPAPRTMSDVARDYLALYESLAAQPALR
jgi:glycosyltransferase involved in cell wall biosynthesis